MRSLGRLFLVLLFLSIPVSASASTPVLSWERSQMQQVEIDSALLQNLQSIQLIGQGETIEFALNPDKTVEGRSIFRVLIPSQHPLGDYAVRANQSDGSSFNLAAIKVVEYQSQDYNPIQDPATVTTLSVTLFALLATWAMTDTPARKRDEYEEDQSTFEGADGGVLGREAGDRRTFRKGLFSSIYLDQIRSVATISSNRISPLLSRLISDSSYLQYSLGSLVLIFPLLGLLLGGIAFQDIQGVGGITTPSVAIVLAIVILGVFDASAGFVAALTFGFVALSSSRFQNIYDFRLFLGLALLFFSASFIANATRTLRKSRKDSDAWERATDVIVGSLLTGWAIKCLVVALNGFAHLRLPLEKHATLIGVSAGLAIAARYLLEGYVNRRNHYYLAYISPKNLHEHNSSYRIIGWFVKGILFAFFAVSFLGVTWHLWIALSIFMLPNILKTVRDSFPNSPTLFQVIPVGVPGLLFMTLFGKAYSDWISSLSLDPATESRSAFVLAAIPSLILTLLKMFGREPEAGDVRWYRRPGNALIYRTGGVVFLAIYSLLTIGLIG